MKYKFGRICMNITKYDVTFTTKGVLTPNLSPSCGYATGIENMHVFIVSQTWASAAEARGLCPPWIFIYSTVDRGL